MTKKTMKTNNGDHMRVFKNNSLEFLSRCHYSVPFILFIPVVLFFFYRSYALGLDIMPILLISIVSIFSWTLFEYFAHTYLLHSMSKALSSRNFLQKSHLQHHEYPLDEHRVVLSPLVSIPGAFLFYFLFYFTMGDPYSSSFFAGFVTGYLIYDFVHYTVHHKSYKIKFFNTLKRHHLLHHYKHPEKNFGLSITFWDKVFRTIK